LPDGSEAAENLLLPSGQGGPQHGTAAKSVGRRPSEHDDSHGSEAAGYLLPPSDQEQGVLQHGIAAEPVR